MRPAPSAAGAATSPVRPAVHASSGRRLGDSHPRQEGPVDLRLVPPALAAWGTAALALDAPPRWVIAAVVVCVVVAGALLVTLTVRGWPTGAGRSAARRQGQECARAAGRRQSWGRVSVATALLCSAAAATSAGLHGADLHRGPVPALARQYAEVDAELEVMSDPRHTRTHITGDRSVPPSVMLNAEIVRVGSANGTTSVTRAPVLVIARDSTAERGRAGDPGRGGRPDPRARPASWFALLPSTRVRVQGSLAPPLPRGDRVAAVLRVSGEREPRVVAGPSGAQQVAGRLRGGLREATDGLSADARALLPGLVVGDTSRVPPDLDEAFRATDLTHLLAVSGAKFG
ncbi:ComEC/Rec2 family competence protein [Streptomyces sp. NPDC050844]|uniref:ComEC/Rec2 family competence protein n=1 Tax=Streptomyces sp. NPDC050844 TaxID=3155790 RepID=UPI0033EA84F4